MNCVYARQVWHMTFVKTRIDPTLMPTVTDRLEHWWGSSRKRVAKRKRKAFDSLVLLVCWNLWKQRNGRVFRNTAAMMSATELVTKIIDELRLWALAGGRVNELV